MEEYRMNEMRANVQYLCILRLAVEDTLRVTYQERPCMVGLSGYLERVDHRATSALYGAMQTNAHRPVR